VGIGLHRVLALPVTLPLPRLVEALNQFQPTYLNVYPSVAMWLADEQAGCWSPTCTTWSNR
jgi:phenylacetate-CoA ligase